MCLSAQNSDEITWFQRSEEQLRMEFGLNDEQVLSFQSNLRDLVSQKAKILVDDRERQEEVIQEVSLKVLRQQHRLYGFHDLSRHKYIAKAVFRTNITISKRSRNKPLPLSENQILEQIASDDLDASEQVDKLKKLEIASVIRDLASDILTADQYDVFKLVLLGMNYQEIADTLGKTSPNCRQLWRKALVNIAKESKRRGWRS